MTFQAAQMPVWMSEAIRRLREQEAAVDALPKGTEAHNAAAQTLAYARENFMALLQSKALIAQARSVLARR